MEQIFTKVKGKKLTDFDDLETMANYAWDVVHRHCQRAFYDSWESIKYASVNPITEEAFFKNYLWCVYVSGFSAKAVTANYDKLLLAHNLVDSRGFFIPALHADPPCKDKVFAIWKNHAKFNAIFDTRKRVRDGWTHFRKTYLDGRNPLDIQNIAFMGPALSRHLARNLGAVNVVKPDVHMLRLAEKFLPKDYEWHETGMDDVERLCRRVTDTCIKMDSWPLGKVDLLLWYAAATLRS